MGYSTAFFRTVLVAIKIIKRDLCGHPSSLSSCTFGRREVVVNCPETGSNRLIKFVVKRGSARFAIDLLCGDKLPRLTHRNRFYNRQSDCYYSTRM